ncbi:peptidoglycan DD-metalloendopeptidase family protein [Cohnella sp. GCM10027633]|uniref:peptidoglycan DD-metalloendopeptidase family protein n=1 Tax=unclassified Cohnella TaxID=2636738 RepID=UPI003635ADE9
MPMRNNVRERRRERIQQLLDEMETKGNDEAADPLLPVPAAPVEAQMKAEHVTTLAPPSAQLPPMSPIMPYDDPDPELWWKEKQRTMKYDTASQWTGMKGLPPTSRAPDLRRAPGRSGLSPWARGMAIRIFIAGLLFGGIWGGMKLELPGSGEAKLWLIDSVSNDMDFEAIEAWYGDTFGGSPSFLPFSPRGVETKEASVSLKPEDTVPPVQGRVVETFAQSGSGVQVAAPGGSDIVSVYAGRVLQVQSEGEGGVTILVEHPSRVLSVYGNLGSAAVGENDWVEAGDKLGELKAATEAGGESSLYFAVQQNGKKLNPTEVVPFD